MLFPPSCQCDPYSSKYDSSMMPVPTSRRMASGVFSKASASVLSRIALSSASYADSSAILHAIASAHSLSVGCFMCSPFAFGSAFLAPESSVSSQRLHIGSEAEYRPQYSQVNVRLPGCFRTHSQTQSNPSSRLPHLHVFPEFDIPLLLHQCLKKVVEQVFQFLRLQHFQYCFHRGFHAVGVTFKSQEIFDCHRRFSTVSVRPCLRASSSTCFRAVSLSGSQPPFNPSVFLFRSPGSLSGAYSLPFPAPVPAVPVCPPWLSATLTPLPQRLPTGHEPGHPRTSLPLPRWCRQSQSCAWLPPCSGPPRCRAPCRCVSQSLSAETVSWLAPKWHGPYFSGIRAP